MSFNSTQPHDILNGLTLLSEYLGQRINMAELQQISFGKLKKEHFSFKEIQQLLKKAGFSSTRQKLNIKKTLKETLFLFDEKSGNWGILANGKVASTGQKPISLEIFYKEHPKIQALLVTRQLSGPAKADALSWFWSPILENKLIFIELLIVGLFMNLFTMALPLFTLTVYDKVLPTFATTTLWMMTVGIGIVLLFDLFFRILRAALLSHINQKVAHIQDENLLEKSLRRQGVSPTVGKQLDIFGLTQQCREILFTSIIPALSDVPFIVLYLGVIYLIAPSLVWIPLSIITCAWIVQALLLPRLMKQAQEAISAGQSKDMLLTDILAARLGIKLFNRLGHTLTQWREQAGKAYLSHHHSQFLQQAGQSIAIGITQMSAVAILIQGAFSVHDGVLSVGGLVACSILAGRAIAPALQMADALSKAQRFKAGLTALRHSTNFNVDVSHATKEKPETLEIPQGHLSAHHVSLRYTPSSPSVVDKINLTLKPGERVAILGKNGAGKSSLAALLSGVLNPTEGSLQFDHINYTSIAEPTLRQHVCFLPQHPTFMAGTVKNTITNSIITNTSKLDEALKVSGFSAVMAQKKMSLDGTIHENAANLSGGQRQLLGLAQAFYQSPKWLILDEPSSQLDHDAEGHLIQTMPAWMNKTKCGLVLISHRLPMLQIVDRILVIEDGRIIADGPRDQILQKIQKR